MQFQPIHIEMTGIWRNLQKADIKNIVLFVGDAVRYQSINQRLLNYGPTFKTIAASLHTPASFATMLTGLNVPEHGVVGFSNVLSTDIVSLVDLDGWNTYFSAKEGTMHEDLHRIFQMAESAHLDDTERPFIWVVRDPGGHAPYNGYDPDTYDQVAETGPEYLNRVAGDDEQIRRDYDSAVNTSLDRFEDAIQYVRERGIEDETLLIYTSDHGELLGEYGMLGHNHVACPELVYVPTTFVHPSLDSGEQETAIRHIDLFPTLTEVLDTDQVDLEQMSGEPIWNKTDDIGYNHFEMVFYNSDLLSNIATEVKSCWNGDGGHVFVESSYKDALLVYLGILAKSYKGKQIRKDRAFIEAFKQFTPGHMTYGAPSFDRTTAEEYIEDLGTRSEAVETTDLDDETKERLDDLGYI